VRKMVDGADFDPCECIWSHELATRRLIDLVSRKNEEFIIVEFRKMIGRRIQCWHYLRTWMLFIS
jgi:hypothetical protein